MTIGTAHHSGFRSVTGWLLEQLLARPDRRSRSLPIVVALGPRGTGKTALLREVQRRCERIPHVYLDFERDDIGTREALGQLAFGLSKAVPQFGRIAFPDLWLCLLVVGSSVHINAGDRRQALAQLRGILARNQPIEQNRQAVIELVEFAGEVASGQSLPGWAAPATDWLLRGMGRIDRWRMLRPIDKLSTTRGKPEDALIDIAKWAHDGDANEQADADAIFCEAFLADLRRAYSGFNRSRRTLDCAVLLDNVHTPGGQRFLYTLQQMRARAADPDPLLVFATSRSWIRYWGVSWHRPGGSIDDESRRPDTHRTGGLDWPPPRPPGAVDEDWRHGNFDESPWSPWYLLDISHLPTPDVVDLAGDFGIHRRTKLTEFVSRLTGGHPGAVVDVLAAAARVEPPDTLRRIFDYPVPQQVWTDPNSLPDTVGMHSEEQVLQDFTEPTDLRDLITASAARNMDVLYHPEILDSAAPNGEAVLEALRNDLWIRERPGDDPDFELHPWLRRILLRALAARELSDPRNWTRTHTLCREVYQRDGQDAAALYHDLALGNIAATVAYLRQAFDTDGAEFDVLLAREWLAELDLITSAPNRLPPDDAPIDQVRELVGEQADELDASLAWLVAALWVTNDPLGDPEQSLYASIDGEFRQLAKGRGRGAMLLYERAERYR
ncbi:ATP-binding protein [Nocardia macrotermitis]|uniref:Uncharacterized protein n=1 Tax=Nocardia macrotermitis TaxID=2585198 RepID=A0A7K0CYX3_9NOCA|nr:ATP-binding protein [Nocardia macrotermitis]MQY18651.1 hypothetical protein [Nocardia macrotermitis]